MSLMLEELLEAFPHELIYYNSHNEHSTHE